MSEIFSARWYRIAQLKPRLTGELVLRRLNQRGQVWYLLTERDRGRSVRLNPAAYALAGRLDGTCTLEQIWNHLLSTAPDPTTQDEVIDILIQLHDARLVQFDQPGDAQRLLVHLERHDKAPQRANALAWRFNLGDPSALLARLAPVGQLLFTRMGALIWLLAVGLLGILALQNADILWAHANRWLTTPRFALLAAVLYIPLKVIHELSHGLAIQRGGGRVHKAGVTFMLGMPVPWVDASAATVFVRRRDRMVVGAAGMMAELMLAAIALPLWLVLDDGLARDVAFVVVFIAGVSTLMFNANPLQRLDGYYIFSDAMDLPNLSTRSRQWWLDLLRKKLLEPHVVETIPTAPGETLWLVVYSPLAWIYAVALGALATMWLGTLSAALGLVAGVVLSWQIVWVPVRRLWTALRNASLAQPTSARRWSRVSVGAGALLIIVFLLPLPQHTTVQGVVWPSDKAQVRADEDGFVSEVWVESGNLVQAGSRLLRLRNPALTLQEETLTARIAALEVEYLQSLPGNSERPAVPPTENRMGALQSELASANAALERVRDRVAALDVKAHATGRLALFQPEDLQDRYFRKASLIGQIVDDSPASIRIALPESQAKDMGSAATTVMVRLASSPWSVQSAHLVADSAGATLLLPSAALSQRHGGDIATDPSDPDDRKAIAPVIWLDVQLDGESAATKRLGERAWIRFDFGYAPLLWQMAVGLQRGILRRFNPQA